MSHTKKMALCGVFAGLALALMWMGSFMPSMDYVLPAMAGMLSVLLALELNRLWATGMFAAAATLCWLLLPNKNIALLYTAFFGYYPILKSLLEGKLPGWVALVCKFAVFNGTMVGVYFLGTKLLGLELDDFGQTFGKFTKQFILALGNLSFAMYNTVLSSFTAAYRKRWRKKLQHIME